MSILMSIAAPANSTSLALEESRSHAPHLDLTSSIASTDFVSLVQQHSRLIYRIALAVSRNPTDAEDVVQECFLQLYRHPQWQQIADHRAYLARTAWRTAIRKQRPLTRDQQLSPAIESLPSPTASPERQAIDQQLQGHIHTLIDGLPEKLRIPLALAALGELKLTEIAAILNLPEGTVRRRIHTARQKLKQQLADSGQLHTPTPKPQTYSQTTSKKGGNA
jgi:RNA polymerase sigma-70 factor (ECF subfamily)